MTYNYTDTNATSVVAHADHVWEQWHAYLTDELPEGIDRAASGICCHTCGLVIVDVLTDEEGAQSPRPTAREVYERRRAERVERMNYTPDAEAVRRSLAWVGRADAPEERERREFAHYCLTHPHADI